MASDKNTFRQTGKTTLAKDAILPRQYLSLEIVDQCRFAREDPRLFLTRLKGTAIPDEVQHVPDILSYIQASVDEDPAPGRFVLTGSQNFLLMGRVAQTLTGHWVG